jgi:hypothetical protein
MIPAPTAGVYLSKVYSTWLDWRIFPMIHARRCTYVHTQYMPCNFRSGSATNFGNDAQGDLQEHGPLELLLRLVQFRELRIPYLDGGNKDETCQLPLQGWWRHHITIVLSNGRELRE